MSTELVLLVSDLFIPLKTSDIYSQFKSILLPNKIQHIICLGNIGNQQTFDWLHSLSNDFHVIKGDYDINRNFPDRKAIQIGNFRIGIIHGHQIIPMGDLEILSNIQRELDCDILVSGYTHQLSVNTKENKLYINPGSLTGALSPLIEDSVPIFWLYSKMILVLGTLFPVEFFPGIFAQIIRYSPIYVTCYGPAKLFVDFSYINAIEIFVSQLIYLGIAWGMCYGLYRKGVRKLNVTGG